MDFVLTSAILPPVVSECCVNIHEVRISEIWFKFTEPVTYVVFIFFLTLFVFSCSVLETENVPRFRISRIRECVGELGAVIQEENQTSTLIVLIFRKLRSSTANTTIPCHTSDSLHYFSGLFIVFSAPSQSSYSVWRHFDSLRAFAIKRVSLHSTS